MFLIDKYAPLTKDKVYFHKKIIEKLDVMSKDSSIPHLIFYGPRGSGKKTFIKILLGLLFDERVHKIRNVVYKVAGSGNSSTDVIIKQSPFHIEINPNNNNFDRYIIQDVVKKYAMRKPLIKSKNDFKIVLINNVDRLPYYAQTSLRRTIENYSHICRFVMWCRSLSSVIYPLRSRCFCFRVPSPKYSDLFKYVYTISMKEGLTLSLEELTEIIDTSNGNIKKALWALSLKKYNNSMKSSYDLALESLMKLLMSCSICVIPNIRKVLYNIMITNIEGSLIIKDITNKMINKFNFSSENMCKLIDIATYYEYKMVHGRREIIHLDAFMISLLQFFLELKKEKENKKIK